LEKPAGSQTIETGGKGPPEACNDELKKAWAIRGRPRLDNVTAICFWSSKGRTLSGGEEKKETEKGKKAQTIQKVMLERLSYRISRDYKNEGRKALQTLKGGEKRRWIDETGFSFSSRDTGQLKFYILRGKENLTRKKQSKGTPVKTP